MSLAEFAALAEQAVSRAGGAPFPEDWDLTSAGLPPVLVTEHPFPIRYNREVWESLHPIDGPRARPVHIHRLPNPRSNIRKR